MRSWESGTKRNYPLAWKRKANARTLGSILIARFPNIRWIVDRGEWATWINGAIVWPRKRFCIQFGRSFKKTSVNVSSPKFLKYRKIFGRVSECSFIVIGLNMYTIMCIAKVGQNFWFFLGGLLEIIKNDNHLFYVVKCMARNILKPLPLTATAINFYEGSKIRFKLFISMLSRILFLSKNSRVRWIFVCSSIMYDRGECHVRKLFFKCQWIWTAKTQHHGIFARQKFQKKSPTEIFPKPIILEWAWVNL